jgi:formylglycine-generating enzyme required for sulfatase activity
LQHLEGHNDLLRPRRCFSPKILGGLRRFAFVIVGFLLLGASIPSAAVNIDWVQVGNPGNAPDTSTNCLGPGGGSSTCGSVANTYYISKYDITNAQYAEFLNAVDPGGSNTLGLWNSNMQTDTSNGGISQVLGNASGSKYVVNSALTNDPVVYTTFYDALRFANWLNNGQGSASTETGAYTLFGSTPTPSNGLTVTRNGGATVFLPSENEWYKAAYYNPISNSYFAYPYGTSTQTTCAAAGATPNTANCNNAVGHVTPVGAYTGSASPYGAYDMGGNVWQWNEQSQEGINRGVRGGNWHISPIFLAASTPDNGAPTLEAEVIGFRVASLVPEPGTGLLTMVGGVLGLTVRRRHARGASLG